MFKIHWNFVSLLHHPFWPFTLFWHFLAYIFNFLNYFLWLRITDGGSVPEMRIWSISLIKSDLKWCIHLGKSLFFNLNSKNRKNIWKWDVSSCFNVACGVSFVICSCVRKSCDQGFFWDKTFGIRELNCYQYLLFFGMIETLLAMHFFSNIFRILCS